MFHLISQIVFALIVVLYGVIGGTALITGRVLVPVWQRGYVLRPRLWGSGALAFVAGMALFRFVVPGGGTTILELVAPCGFVLMVAGVVLQILGRHPGRVRV
ncbi:hypothetical protein [Streptomyces sp. NPDC002573]|uniref:hypothetical protein n=1 Tax=Streptomyces sp. NPDC002573 TaxID=3364651 RepID=UPI0036AFAAD7